jgi:ParB family chromosome partitioning protein
VQSAVGSGVITAGHARALVALDGQAAQEHGLKVVVARHLSVRQTENWVRTYRPRKKLRVDSTAELRAIAADIESKVGLPIKLTGSLNRGRIDLRYSSREELERVRSKLLS